MDIKTQSNKNNFSEEAKKKEITENEEEEEGVVGVPPLSCVLLHWVLEHRRLKRKRNRQATFFVRLKISLSRRRRSSRGEDCTSSF